MTKLPIRKRLENVPQFSGSVDAAVAEYRVVDCLLRLSVIKGNGTRDNPDPRPRIWGCYKFDLPLKRHLAGNIGDNPSPKRQRPWPWSVRS
ncbi:hypothetical protein AgCh_018388 [Apium graveolens]